MADKNDFAARLARIETKNATGSAEPELLAGVSPEISGQEERGSRRSSSRIFGLLLSLSVGLCLIGGAFYATLLHMEQDSPGLRAAILEEGGSFNPLEFLTQSTAGESRWNQAQEAPLEDRYLNEDGSSKLSEMGRFILNN